MTAVNAPSTIGPEAWAEILSQTQDYVREHMSRYDSSHDWSHIQRVVSLAQMIFDSEAAILPCRQQLVLLAAYLHDIGDKKYVTAGQDPSTMVSTFLTSAQVQCPAGLADAVQDVVSHVSYSNEKKNPQSVQDCLQRWPELAIVQDADRLDAIGAVGIGRCFTFSATQATKSTSQSSKSSMEDSIEHFSDKLVRLEAMMKTATGKRMAKQRTERIKLFQAWWTEETI